MFALSHLPQRSGLLFDKIHCVTDLLLLLLLFSVNCKHSYQIELSSYHQKLSARASDYFTQF